MAANLSKRWRVDTLLFCLFSLPMVAVFLLGFATPAKAQGAVLCTCYCGARLYPPCSEEACKSACGYSEPRQGGGEGGGGGGGRVTRPPANPCARWPATVYDRGQNRCVCPGGSQWDKRANKCMCQNGMAWDKRLRKCACPANSSWDSTKDMCMCPAGTAWNGKRCATASSGGGARPGSSGGGSGSGRGGAFWWQTARSCSECSEGLMAALGKIQRQIARVRDEQLIEHYKETILGYERCNKRFGDKCEELDPGGWNNYQFLLSCRKFLEPQSDNSKVTADNLDTCLSVWAD